MGNVWPPTVREMGSDTATCTSPLLMIVSQIADGSGEAETAGVTRTTSRGMPGLASGLKRTLRNPRTAISTMARSMRTTPPTTITTHSQARAGRPVDDEFPGAGAGADSVI
jgi:hypothetical protein